MIADEILAFLSIVGLIAFFYGPWQGVCTDVARQLLFEQRAELFRLAASGKISFKSEEYTSSRLSIERTIRFAHDLTAFRLVYLKYTIVTDTVHRTGFAQAIEKANNVEVKIALNSISNKCSMILVGLLVCRSAILIFLMPALVLLYFYPKISTYTMFVKRQAKAVGEIAQHEASICA